MCGVWAQSHGIVSSSSTTCSRIMITYRSLERQFRATNLLYIFLIAGCHLEPISWIF